MASGWKQSLELAKFSISNYPTVRLMKTLIFLRHGKSDWHATYGTDHSRPLNKRGEKAANLMGQFLRKTNQIPDRVVTSSAVRALTTAQIASKAGNWDCPVRVADSLYGASPEEVLGEIRSEPDKADILLLAGHEPTCSQSIGMFIGRGFVRFPTAAMARIDFNATSWDQVDFGRGQLSWLVTPKLLQKLGIQH